MKLVDKFGIRTHRLSAAYYRGLLYVGIAVGVLGFPFGLKHQGSDRWIEWIATWALSFSLIICGVMSLFRIHRAASASRNGVSGSVPQGQRANSISKLTLIDDLSKRHLIERVAPKWGDPASEFIWKARQSRKLVIMTAGVFLIIIGVGNFESIVTWALLLVVASLGVLALFIMLRYSRKAYEAASVTLGVKVNRGNAPPLDSVAYEQWCANHGLRPYSASQRNDHE